MRARLALLLCVVPVAAISAACASSYDAAELDIDETQSDCASDDPRVGTSAALRGPFPVGVTLDDVQQLSIWCVPAAANFGDADLGGA